MTKHSKREREQRASETTRVKEIESAWVASLPAPVATAFADSVAAARRRGPIGPPPLQAPGTQPNPPRPGHEPKPPKQERPRRSR